MNAPGIALAPPFLEAFLHNEMLYHCRRILVRRCAVKCPRKIVRREALLAYHNPRFISMLNNVCQELLSSTNIAFVSIAGFLHVYELLHHFYLQLLQCLQTCSRCRGLLCGCVLGLRHPGGWR